MLTEERNRTDTKHSRRLRLCNKQWTHSTPVKETEDVQSTILSGITLLALCL